MQGIIKDLQETAKEYVVKNKFKEALSIVTNFIKEYSLQGSQIEKHLISISSEYFNIRSRGVNGTLSFEETRTIEANLTSRFLILIDDLYELDTEKIEKKKEIEYEKDLQDYPTTIAEVNTFNQISQQLNYIINQIITSDDKINDIKVTIEDKKIEITKTQNSEEIKVLNQEIISLKEELESEKENYNNIKSQYDELKFKYEGKGSDEFRIGGIEEDTEEECKNCGLRLDVDSKCLSCGYENDDLKMIRDQLNYIKKEFQGMREKTDKIVLKEMRQNNNIILQYLDDLNRRLGRIEKLNE